jgi:hypothetical protein
MKSSIFEVTNRANFDRPFLLNLDLINPDTLLDNHDE